MKDVAKEARVSPATVSRVFNNNPNISEKTRKHVLEVATRLGYKPRKYTSQQKNATPKNIAVVFSNRLINLTDDPFYGQVMNGIEESISQHNYNLIFRTVTGNSDLDMERVESLISDDDLSGIILIGYEINEELVQLIVESRIPLVLVDSNLHDENINLVLNDNITGARVAVDYLIGLGHKRIGFVGGPLYHMSLDERYIGYKQALKRAGIERDNEQIVICEPTFEVDDGFRATKAMLNNSDHMPTAIFAANDMLAIGVMKAINTKGYDVPKDISVIGFDDIQMAQHTIPSLTTVKIFKKEMGIIAGKRLLELIRGKASKSLKLIVAVELVVRDSISVPPN